MEYRWICYNCGHRWKSTCCICEICTEIGVEQQSQDALDDIDFISIDEYIETIENKYNDDEEERWNY